MDKFCKTCERTLPRSDFHKSKTLPDGLGFYCKDCTLEGVRRSREKRVALVEEFKAQPCMDCGVSYPPHVMDCDHLPGTGKVDNVSYLMNSGSLRRIQLELAKCEPVCANCHRARTERRRLAA